MKIENEWLDSEIDALKCEKQRKQKKKNTDNMLAFKLVLMLSAVFFYVPVIDARPHAMILSKIKHHNTNMKAMDGGRHFICSKCRTCQWQDNKNADWSGNFFCSACGNNLGK